MWLVVKCLSLTSLVFCMMAASALAQSVPERIELKYKNINSMRCEYAQTLLHKESGSRETRGGTLSFSKPLLLRMETKKPSPELLLVAKDAIWNAFPEEEIAYKYSLAPAQDSRSIIRVITGQASLDKDFFVEKKKDDGGLLVVDLFPKEPTQALVEVRLWVDPKTDLIKKLRVYDFYGNENELVFSRQEINVGIPASQFSYTPPKGFVVEDRAGDASAAPGVM